MKNYFTSILGKLNTIKIILIFSTFFQSDIANSQVNLIPNPSFENIQYCPVVAFTTLSPLTSNFELVNNWKTATYAPYLNCAGGFNQYPGKVAQHGSAYVSLHAHEQQGPCCSGDYKSNISVPLTSTLVAGTLYKFSFYFMGQSDWDISQKFGLCFSPTAPAAANFLAGGRGCLDPTFYPLNRTLIPAGSSAYTSTTWTKVTLSYIAKGGEAFMTVGNFESGTGGVSRTIAAFIDNFETAGAPSCVAGTSAPIRN